MIIKVLSLYVSSFCGFPNTINRLLCFLRPKPHPQTTWVWAGGFKTEVPTTLQHGRTIDNYAANAQQRPAH